MLTGRYSHNNGVLTNFFPSGGYLQFDTPNNLAVLASERRLQDQPRGQVLNQYGDNDPTEVPPGSNDWHTVIGDARLFYGYKVNDNGVVSIPTEPSTREPAAIRRRTRRAVQVTLRRCRNATTSQI